VVAGVFETGFSIGLKYSEGFTRFWPSVATAIMIVVRLGLVGVATRSLTLGTAYAEWDRDWRSGYGGARHRVVWGVCGFEQGWLAWG
jgi:multidrug transporter EmrE-like cation transporter